MKKLIIFFGPPGSGKTYQAKRLCSIDNFRYCSWGEISRRISLGKIYPELTNVVRRIHQQRRPFPTSMISRVILQELTTIFAGSNNVILDGFPRRESEAKELLKIIKDLQIDSACAIIFNIDYESALKRLQNRNICLECGMTYSDRHKRCPNDGILLAKREDDDFSEARKRFDTYVEESLVAIDTLKQVGIAVETINASSNYQSVHIEVLLALNKIQIKDCYYWEEKAATKLVTQSGVFKLAAFQNRIDYTIVLTLIRGTISGKRSVPVRIHSSCITGDIFQSLHCDCGEQLKKSLEFINKNKSGIVLYLFQEGRGINIINKILAYSKQFDGLDTVEANTALGLPNDVRDYKPVKEILDHFNVISINLMTNNPEKIEKLLSLGIIIEKVTNLSIKANPVSKRYLETKKIKLGHMIKGEL